MNPSWVIVARMDEIADDGYRPHDDIPLGRDRDRCCALIPTRACTAITGKWNGIDDSPGVERLSLLGEGHGGRGPIADQANSNCHGSR